MSTPKLATVEPTVVTVKRYVCPFCSRGRSKRPATVEHIGRCWMNPAVRSCKTCAHLVIEWAEPEIGLSGAVFCDVDVDLDDPTLERAGLVTNCEKWAAAE